MPRFLPLLRSLIAIACAALAAGAGTAVAATVNVAIDPTAAWNGYENLYYANGAYWRGDYFVPPTAGIIQGSISGSGLIVCAPDLRMERDFPLDTNAWADASGSSPGICKVDSTYYVDTATLATAGDTVVFSGRLLLNTLAPSYSNSIVAFIKDYSSDYSVLRGTSALNLNRLTNGQIFQVSQGIPAAGDHLQWGFEWAGSPARSNTVAGLGFALLSPPTPPQGASVPWTTYEAEQMTVAGGVILGPQYTANTVASESSARQCVRLAGAGQYVQFTARAAANALVVRCSVPDTADGAGADYTLSLYQNGNFLQKVPVTSRYSWLYGAYPFTNNPTMGSPRDFYDEARVGGLVINPGDVIRLQQDPDDSAASYILDLVDLEQVPAPLAAPPNALSLTNYGAVGDGVTDCTVALRNCIGAAVSQARPVWLPPGNFLITGAVNLPTGTTLQGAGMWYTTLSGSASLYNVQPARRVNLYGMGSNIHLADFAILGRLQYRNDTEPNDGIGGSYGTGSSISRLWIEHTKTAAWVLNSQGLVVDSCRFRDTIADGINVNFGMRGCVVTNCSARGTGDDGFAIWPAPGTETFASGSNVITHCTTQGGFLANGGAIYGGAGNLIENCLVQDIAYDCGVLISTTFPVGANVFSGITSVRYCDLVRCGNNAGLQVCLQNGSLTGLRLDHLNITDSGADGLSIIAPGSNPGAGNGLLRNAGMTGVIIPNYGLGGAGNCLWARSDAAGSLGVTNSLIAQWRNDSANFAFVFGGPPTLPPTVVQWTLPAVGVLAAGFAGAPDAAYVISRSASLSGPWAPFATNTSWADGTWWFSDAGATNLQQFYRATPR